MESLVFGSFVSSDLAGSSFRLNRSKGENIFLIWRYQPLPSYLLA